MLVVLPIGFLIEGTSQSGVVWYLPSVCAIGVGIISIVWAEMSGVVFPASWGPWRWTEGTVWLDKCCIDQTNDATKQAGIRRLKDFLARSRSMTVLLGPTYFDRLWCTYELACFCDLHSKKELETTLHFVSLEWAWWTRGVWLVRGVKLSEWEINLLDNYSCRDASCFMPKDRGTVLARIRKQWGSEEAFDTFVRKEFPALLLRGKQQFMSRPLKTMWKTLELLF